MDEPVCPGCRELLQRVAELEAQVAELTRRLDDALRAGKRQAAPFRKGPPKPDPKTPGRKSGDAHGRHGHRPPPPPEQVAECHEAHLPDACPHCRGRPVQTAATFPDGSERNALPGLRAYLRERRQGDFLDNLCRKLLAYALGRSVQLSDQRLLDEMRSRLEADRYAFGSMVEAIGASLQFRNRRHLSMPR